MQLPRKQILTIREYRPESALEALNRLTGLTWESLPESLLPWVSEALRGDEAESGEAQAEVMPDAAAAASVTPLHAERATHRRENADRSERRGSLLSDPQCRHAR